MNNIIPALQNCILFENFSYEEIENLLNSVNYKASNYSKEETIAIEEEKCSNIGILIEGNIEIKKIFASGKSLVIDRLEPGNIFGEVIIFSQTDQYPSTIVSLGSSKVIFINKNDIIKLCNLDNRILNNFMGLLSNKILMLNKKIKNLSYHSIRQKVSNYILEEYKNQKRFKLNINYSRKDLAEHLGIPRPSLSRELINLKTEGIIDFNKSTITINNLTMLEDFLLN